MSLDVIKSCGNCLMIICHSISFMFSFLISNFWAASLLLGVNGSRSDKTSRETSDSPFSFPRQRRSVRPRLHLSIDSGSE